MLYIHSVVTCNTLDICDIWCLFNCWGSECCLSITLWYVSLLIYVIYDIYLNLRQWMLSIHNIVMCITLDICDMWCLFNCWGSECCLSIILWYVSLLIYVIYDIYLNLRQWCCLSIILWCVSFLICVICDIYLNAEAVNVVYQRYCDEHHF